MVTPMQFSKFKLKMACIQKLGRTVLFFTGETSKYSLINKLSKPFLRQCRMMDLDPRCFSKTTSSELRNSSRVDLLHFGKWEIPWSLRISHEKYATLISTAKHKRTLTRLRNLIRIIYLFIRLLKSGVLILRKKLTQSKPNFENLEHQSTLSIYKKQSYLSEHFCSKITNNILKILFLNQIKQFILTVIMLIPSPMC